MEVLISTLKEMVSFIKDWGALIIAGISLLVAIISLSKSSKAQRLQNKVNELELKIKQDELDKIMIMGQEKQPFEELEARKSYELVLITHNGSASKFRIVTEWTDSSGNQHTKTQMGDFS